MVKREASSNTLAESDTPSAKRRKEELAEAPPGDDVEAQDAGANSDQEEDAGGGVAGEGPTMSPDEIRDEGLKMLQVLKEAKNKEERLISHDFWRLPSKRQFPDYYEIIKRPIALDDIKANLGLLTYTTLEALRQDLELCFKNAKKYNMRESMIWKDAKSLQKLSNKEVDKIRRDYGDEDDEGEGSDKEPGKKKEKGVNIHRLMKNRLQKLIAKTDENELLICGPFMNLVNKKKWPGYYKIIKRPICIEDIFKRIKRKEYHTISDYMADVDQVFDNAMHFNEEGSEIWSHASILKNHFHQLMSDLPAKYNMSREGASLETLPNKIKLKIPGHHGASHAEANAEPRETGGGTIRLRVPALSGDTSATTNSTQPATINAAANGVDATPAKKEKAKSPVAPTTQLPSTSSLPAPTPKLAKAIPFHLRQTVAEQQQVPIASPTPATPSTSTYPYTSNVQIPPSAFYTPPLNNTMVATPPRASATPAPLPTSVAGGARTGAPSPKPSVRAAGIHSVRLEVTPTGRRLPLLDLDGGVRNWAVRLGSDERGLVVKDIRFERSAEVEDGSDEEREKDPSGVVSPPKKRGRGRPRKNPIVDKVPESPIKEASEASPETALKLKKSDTIIPPAENVVIRLDGVLVASAAKSKPDGGREASEAMNGVADAKDWNALDEWNVDLSAGRHILEVGRKGNGVLWQVYVYV